MAGNRAPGVSSRRPIAARSWSSSWR
jgi:hypothetical protein